MGSRNNPPATIFEISVHNFGLVFHKKLLARKTGCCIVVSPMPVFFFAKQGICKKTGMGPYF